MKFGDNLRSLRKSRKLSQDDLAKKVNVSRQSVIQMTQNIQDLLYFKGKIEETNIIVKREEKAKIDYNLSIMVSINI